MKPTNLAKFYPKHSNAITAPARKPLIPYAPKVTPLFVALWVTYGLAAIVLAIVW